MGAYGIGSIRRLCDFVEPQYGIVTAVGHAHTERFGGLDAIAQAKNELTQEVCGAGGHMVLNAQVLDFEPFRQSKERFGDRITTVGFDPGADLIIEQAEWRDDAWTIELRKAAGEAQSVTYQLPLLGEHNVINSALAVALALQIGRTSFSLDTSHRRGGEIVEQRQSFHSWSLGLQVSWLLGL